MTFEDYYTFAFTRMLWETDQEHDILSTVFRLVLTQFTLRADLYILLPALITDILNNLRKKHS